jgi:hypothetical protein
MVDQGLMALTGQSTVANAWGVLLPNYHSGQGIAVKVSFNNSQDFSGGAAIDAVIGPVNALISGLKARGVAEADIWIYDAIRVLPDRFVDNCPYSNVRFFCKSTDPSRPRLALATFDSAQPSAQVTFNPPPGVPSPSTIRVSDVVVNATYVINMPIMKVHSFGTTGVSLGFKNHWGTIDHPSDVHDWIMLDGPNRRANYNGLLDVFKNPHIGPKTVLTLADGLFGSVNGYSVPPVMWSTFGNKPSNSLLFAADPVAMDCVLCDFVKAEAGEMPDTDSYLQLAHGAGLGVYERGDPWSTSTKYNTIDYTTIEL